MNREDARERRASGDDTAHAWARHRRKQRRLIFAGFVLALAVYMTLRVVVAPWLNPLLGL
jgi:hypothetical protein